jgi:hypothetical protein
LPLSYDDYDVGPVSKTPKPQSQSAGSVGVLVRQHHHELAGVGAQLQHTAAADVLVVEHGVQPPQTANPCRHAPLETH